MNENDEQLKSEVLAWWARIQHNPGGLSRLKHQSDILGIEGVECFYDLASRIPGVDIDVLAAIAMAVSHIEVNSKDSLAHNMGRKKNGREAVSEIRMNRLIELTLPELSRELIRIMPLVDNTANICKLSVDLKYWDSEKQYSKKQWLNDYYLANGKD